MKNIHEYTRQEFEALKLRIHNVPNHKYIDSDICALYYGLWWKFAYNGGTPSKEMVFESLNIDTKRFTSEALFQKAKQGGMRIRLKWIQLENTLYFKTLLLQGGIPLQYLARNHVVFRKFLLKVIELQPTNTNTIGDNYELIKYLPVSSRNDVVYEAALIISNAIWENTNEGQEILNLLQQNQFQNLVDELKSHKEKVDKKSKASIKISSLWELTQIGLDTAVINLKFDIPERLENTSLAEMIGINPEELMPSYNLFCDDDILSTFRKNIKGDFLKFSSTTVQKLWKPDNPQLPVVYFLDNSGKKYSIPLCVKEIPNKDLPSLWIQMEENRWIMSAKNNHNGENAFVLTSNINNCKEHHINLIIENTPLFLYEINESTTIQINDQETVCFKLNSSSFDWSIYAEQPKWISSANMIVITALPKIDFYTESGSKIQDALVSKKWRKKGDIIWNGYSGTIPEGIIQLMFCYNNEIEFEKVFNIGNLTMNVSIENILSYNISASKTSLGLKIQPNNNLITTSEVARNSIKIKYISPVHIYSQTQGYLISTNGLLSFYLELPKQGIDVINKDDIVLPDNKLLLLDNINGCRIVCGADQTMKLYNEQVPDLIIYQSLSPGAIPLRNYNTIIQKLFLLADVMSSTNVVVMEIKGKSIKFQSFNTAFNYLNDRGIIKRQEDGRVLFQFKNSDLENVNASNYIPYAVALNCDFDNIVPIEMERCEFGYCLPCDIADQEFIVFDKQSEIKNKILPTYASTNQENIIFPIDAVKLKQRKIYRIDTFSNILTEEIFEGDEWLKLTKYIQICTQFNLPFSAFDNIRASITSSDLTAKLLFILILYSKSDEDFVRTFVKMEDDLGFRFHWCAFDSIETAFNYTISKHGHEIISSIFQRTNLVIERKYLFCEKMLWSMPQDFHLKTEIRNMRTRLGEAIINELPERFPYISEDRSNIINISTTSKIGIMAICPIAICLMKLNTYSAELPKGRNITDLWHPNNNIIRRNIMYCENLDQSWYDLALRYTLNKINKF